MRRYSPISVVVLACLLWAGCREQREVVPPVNGDDEPAVCLQGEPFLTDGEIPVAAGARGDAPVITGLRWEAHDGCERFVIDLGAEDDGPATSAGAVTAELLRDLGVVRVSLHEVERVAQEATEATFAGPLARGAYAVWSPDGRWIYVDVHLGDDAEAHVAQLEEPARVVVDLRPGGAPLPDPPASNDRVVVLAPRPGEAAYPLTVAGYARHFEANVVVRLEQDGQDVFEDFTTATAWVDAWGHYELTIDDGPAGHVVVHVGEHSAKDGTWEGAAIELEMQ